MKIQTLLEAEIKVPQKTYNEIMNVVCSDFFSRLATHLLSVDKFDVYLKLKPTIEYYKKQFGNFVIYDDYNDGEWLTNTVTLYKKDIEKRYIKKDIKLKNEQIIVQVAVNTWSDATGEFVLEGGKTYINVSSPTKEQVAYFANRPEFIKSWLINVGGAVRHELMHAIQHFVWNQIEDSKHSRDEHGAIDNNIYHLDPTEYKPLIHSTLKFLESQENIISTQFNRELTALERKALFKAVVLPGAPSVFGLERLLSDFYATLYSRAPVKWKKAVKSLYGLYMRS